MLSYVSPYLPVHPGEVEKEAGCDRKRYRDTMRNENKDRLGVHPEVMRWGIERGGGGESRR